MMIRCSGCGRALAVTEANTVKAGTPKNRAAVRPPQNDVLGGGEPRCARCGRLLRGDWDRYTTDEGYVCHICANIAAAEYSASPAIPPPEMTAASTALIAERPPRFQEEMEANDADAGWFDRFKETRYFKVGLLTSAWATIVLVVILTITESRQPLPERAPPEQARVGLGLLGPAATMTSAQEATVGRVIQVMQVFFLYAACFAALYLTLAISGRLPCDTLWRNVLHVGIVALIMRIMQMFIPLAVGLILPMGGLLALVLVIYLLYEVYSLSFSDFVLFFLFSWLFGILFTALGKMALGGLALLLF